MNAAERSLSPPDIALRGYKRMSLRDIRVLLDMVQELVSDSSAVHDSIERDDELITGRELLERMKQAESDLYLHEVAMKQKVTGYVPGEARVTP